MSVVFFFPVPVIGHPLLVVVIPCPSQVIPVIIHGPSLSSVGYGVVALVGASRSGGVGWGCHVIVR